MNVLFVDDQISVLNGIQAGVHFEALGIDNVQYATSAVRAVEIMDTFPVDIVLCDVEMPGENGLHLIRKIQKSHPDVVCIMLTSHAEFEYAQESIRLGCFDYIIQPAPYDEIEDVLRRALQHRYEIRKRNQLIEIGKQFHTGEMELLDRVTMNLFSKEEEEVRSSLEFLRLMGYSATPKKKARILLLSADQFRRTELSGEMERNVHKQLNIALKQVGISYPLIPLSSLNSHREFVLLIFSALQDEPELSMNKLRQFFDCFCQSLTTATASCLVGAATCFDSLGGEYCRLRECAQGQSTEGIVRMEYDPDRIQAGVEESIIGDGSRWRSLLANGQHRILLNEFEECLSHICAYSQHKSRALCDLHQHMAHMFLAYFYDNHMDVHALFTGEYSYYDFMVSYASADSLRTAMHYMMKQVKELNTTQFQRSDVEKAKSFILDNITDAITVKNVADHVCLSAEYFTKLFKKETGQNIKEYITQMKVEAAKDLLEHSNISVSMVALELGYTNFSHFSQVFRKYVEVTPSEYRAALRKEEQS